MYAPFPLRHRRRRCPRHLSPHRAAAGSSPVVDDAAAPRVHHARRSPCHRSPGVTSTQTVAPSVADTDAAATSNPTLLPSTSPAPLAWQEVESELGSACGLNFMAVWHRSPTPSPPCKRSRVS